MNAENHNAHERYEELVDRALDGGLSAAEAEELDRHVAECGSCTELLQVVRATAEAWREAPDEPLPDAVRDAVALAAAAAIALILAWPDPLDAPSPSQPRQLAEADTAAPAQPAPLSPEIGSPLRLAGRATVTSSSGKPVPVTDDVRLRSGDVVTLEEGAELGIELNGIARLHLASSAVLRLGADDSGVELDLRRGSVAARVEPRDQGQEFAVATPAGTVEVTSTIFRVQVASTAEVAVEVVEGKVVVRDRADERNVVAVAAGQVLALDWSAPEAAPLEQEPRGEILALFGMGARDPDEGEDAAATGSVGGKSKWERLFDEALQLRKDKRHDEALAIYERIASKAPSKRVRAEAAFTMGQLRYATGDYRGAERDLARQLELHGQSGYREMALFYLAKSRIKLGRCPAAVRALDELIAKAPSHKLSAKARQLRQQCAGAAGD
jgi:TolA-binding protein